MLAGASGMKSAAMSFLHASKCRMLAVLHLEPMLLPAAAVGSVAVLGH